MASSSQVEGGEPSTTGGASSADGSTRSDGLAAVVVFSIALYAMVQVESFSPSARILPRIVGYPMLLASAVDMVRSIWRRIAARRADAGRGAGELGTLRSSLPEELSPFLWFAGYILALFVLGFTLASVSFLFIYLRFGHRERYAIVLPLTVGIVGAIYVLFHRVAGVQLYEGYLGSFLSL